MFQKHSLTVTRAGGASLPLNRWPPVITSSLCRGLADEWWVGHSSICLREPHPSPFSRLLRHAGDTLGEFYPPPTGGFFVPKEHAKMQYIFSFFCDKLHFISIFFLPKELTKMQDIFIFFVPKECAFMRDQRLWMPTYFFFYKYIYIYFLELCLNLQHIQLVYRAFYASVTLKTPLPNQLNL